MPPRLYVPSSTRPPIGLAAQLLASLAAGVLALVIIHVSGTPLRALFAGPVRPAYQMLIGQGLALVGGALVYGLWRVDAHYALAAMQRRYRRLDLRGHNPLLIALAAAFGEELLLRAALQPLLGIWIVSLLFVLAHVPLDQLRRLERAALVQAAGVFAAGVALGFVFARVGLLAAMVVHWWAAIVSLVLARSSVEQG
ncbi:CPBP family intramembrane metalloprotease [Massilia forsythiae]|uniref:CPBP family intramembrane metalloprotease n=1 Tax=Massilia forsythiae TaxID=2728020 RepID=A0A7Z2VWM8_9BURK|nr:CPBP family intramembrane glutamic endopeptidase [Massilia forsythiae]QJE00559.1 CPBP family intramembrane metalloprotease [Massilia forsythiae]